MKLSKNDILKIAALLLICAGIIGAFFLIPEKVTEKKLPSKFAKLETMLQEESKASSKEIIQELARLAAANREHRDCDEVAFLARKIIRSGKVEKSDLIFTRFTLYSALFSGERIKEALAETDALLSMDLPAPVRGAVLGEKARCLARLEGAASALRFLDQELVRPETAPGAKPFLYNMYASILHESGKRTEGIAKLLQGAGEKAFSAEEKEICLKGASSLLSGAEDPAETLKKAGGDRLSPVLRFRILDMTCDMLMREKNFQKAGKIYEAYVSDPGNPANFRKIAELKLEICREGPVK